jgi:S1-C subfamily serine protease
MNPSPRTTTRTASRTTTNRGPATPQPTTVVRSTASRGSAERDASTERAFLGVRLDLLEPSTDGAVVVAAVPDSAAEAAGVAAGDTLRSIQGHRLSTSVDVAAALARCRPGDRVDLTWRTPQGFTKVARTTLRAGPAR